VKSRTHYKKRGGNRKAIRVGKQNLIQMKKIKTFCALILVAIFMSSCALTLPVNATSNPIGNKVGTAKATGFLGIIFFDADASIRTAAKNGGISRISTVDIKQTNLLNLIFTYETIVTGE
jgi:hypothetical protein